MTKCKYPEFKGNVAAVYTHPLENTPGSSGGHYGHDAITYMNVGMAMGEEMAKMKAAAAAAASASSSLARQATSSW